MSTTRIQELIRQQFAIAQELTELTGRPFTLDGHAVGSAGEVIAAARFGLTLTDPSTKGIDAHCDGRSVEIKATAGKTIALRGMEPMAEQLLALQFNGDGTAETIYNGPASPVWAAISHKAMGSNGQRQVSLRLLRELQALVAQEQQLPELGP